MVNKKDYSTNSFINECFRGYGQYVYHSKALAKMSPENRALFLQTYRDSLGLNDSKISDHITKYQAARAATLASLPPSIAFDKNPQRLQTLLGSFNSLDFAIKNIGAHYHPDNLTKYLEEERQKAIGVIIQGTPPHQKKIKGAILQQYEEDLQLIESTLKDPVQKKNAIETLKSAHAAQLKALEEGIKKDIDHLHKAVEKERQRVSTFAVLRHEVQSMKKAFDQAYFKNQEENMTVSMAGAGGIFKDLDFNSLVNYVGNNFETLTGRKIGVEQTGSQPTTHKLSIQLPSTSTFDKIKGLAFRDFGYYGDQSNRPMQDMLTLANLLKLSGEEKPYAEINGFVKHPELAMKMAQDAYAALLMAGYTEDKIKIIVNGKSYSSTEKENHLGQLFKDNPGKKQEIDALVGMHRRPIESETFESMRSEMEKERQKYASPPSSATPSTGPGTI